MAERKRAGRAGRRTRPGVRVVLTTVPDAEVGARLARTLVEEGLAACVNLVPGVRSIYRWQGRLEDAREVLLLVKTRADRCRALAARIQALHPYELPEVLELAAGGGSAAYLDWVRRESAR
ncbi:MAG TPA: divalent-cation tolerance protein CutA [Myxococcota bacterium]